MKKLFLLTIIIISSLAGFAQSIHHGIGIGGTFDNVIKGRPGEGSVLLYHPRVNFAETEKTAISVGIPLSIGYIDNRGSDDEYDYYDDDVYVSEKYSFLINVPVMVNLNFGGGSSPLNHKQFGGYVGVGYGYNYSSKKDYYTYNDFGDETYGGRVGGGSAGPAANAGARMVIGDSRSIEIRVSYFRGMNRHKFDMFGFGVMLNF